MKVHPRTLLVSYVLLSIAAGVLGGVANYLGAQTDVLGVPLYDPAIITGLTVGYIILAILGFMFMLLWGITISNSVHLLRQKLPIPETRSDALLRPLIQS